MNNTNESDCDPSSEHSHITNSSNNTDTPCPTPRISLPVRFANPNISESERPIAELSSDLLGGRVEQLINTTENFLQNINQNLTEVDRVIGNFDNILEQTINTNNMENDRALFNQNNTEPGTSREFNTDSQKFLVTNKENRNTPIMDRTIPNQSHTPVIQNLFTEPSTRSDKSVDTIGLEAAT